MTTPFDPTRLDEECERIAAYLSSPCYNWGTWDADLVKHVIMGTATGLPMGFVRAVYALCRRPKMVPA
jgi:hypothetical protein